MYYAIVATLMFAFPLLSIAAEVATSDASLGAAVYGLASAVSGR
jgi:hypothetical protein